MTEIHQAFKARLTQVIRNKDRPLPIKQVAHEAGCHVSYLRKLMNGTQDNPTLGTITALAKATKTSPAWLLGFQDQPG